jgi:GxxExxY protein
MKSLPAIASSGEAGGEERIVKKIVDTAYAIHKTLRPGLLERVYETCFFHQLSKRGLEYQRIIL